MVESIESLLENGLFDVSYCKTCKKTYYFSKSDTYKDKFYKCSECRKNKDVCTIQ